jgi:hypothetical protein
MLTPSEIEELRRNAKEAAAYALKAFEQAETPPLPPVGHSSPMLTPSEIKELRRKSNETLAYARHAFGLPKHNGPEVQGETLNPSADMSLPEPTSARLLSQSGRWRTILKVARRGLDRIRF